MASKFSKKTFEYFEAAKKNKKNLAWFDKNEEMYLEHVKEPFSVFVQKLDLEFGGKIPGFKFDPKKLSGPTYRKNNVPSDGTVVKKSAYVFFSEKATSMYEWNPGIYLAVGTEAIEAGVGLYMLSSRQTKLLRSKIMQDPQTIRKILNDKKFVKAWGGLAGDKYKRFPKEYDPNADGAEYLWHKQFYVGKEYTRTQIINSKFTETLIQDYKAALPFLEWIRNTVGMYRKPQEYGFRDS